MHLNDLRTDAAVLAELGHRLTRHRLERNSTQSELAAEAGVGQATVQRAERGESVQITSMIKLLRTLGLLGGLDAAIPESIDLPIAQLEREQRKRRRRASGRPRRAGGRDDRSAGDPRNPSPAGGRGKPSAGNPNHPPTGARGHPSADPLDQPWTWGDEPGGAAA